MSEAIDLAGLEQKLRNALGPHGVTTDPGDLAPFLEEWRRRATGRTPFMVQPATTEEVATVVRLCVSEGAAITPQGGNTGLVGGQSPQGEVLLSLRRMNRIRSVDAEADAMTAEAGVILANVHESAQTVGRHFPLSLGSQGSATIGGLISTNAGGVHVMRYGMMRELVLGIEAVLPDGEILHGLRALRKDNTGYDLKQLFIGAEGTLGVVTAATLRLFPKPNSRVVAMAATETPESAIALLHRIKGESSALSAFELMNALSVTLASALPGVRQPFTSPWTVLLEFESAEVRGLEDDVEAILGRAFEERLITDAAIARSEQAILDFWKLREMIPAGHRSVDARQVSLDTSTPVSLVPEFLFKAGAAVERLSPGAQIVAFGHAGDGNIHYTAMAASPDAPFSSDAIGAAVHDVAVSLGGSISAEHGIGVFRRDELLRFKDPVALALMRRLKEALDPARTMNPRALV